MQESLTNNRERSLSDRTGTKFTAYKYTFSDVPR